MSQHLLTLQPTDVLFFRDGRPMEGSSSGHGACWPLPNVINSALHHALRRGLELDDVHRHTPKRSGETLDENRTREFGSLKSAGPFPVDRSGRWFFPRPADAEKPDSSKTTHFPAVELPAGNTSNLPKSLLPVLASQPPTKERPANWWSSEAWQAYLEESDQTDKAHFAKDDAFFGAEHNIGIGIDPETQSQDGERFYSASYLRLLEGSGIGLVAECLDKGPDGEVPTLDLIDRVFPNSGAETHILAGGQQRTCRVRRETRDRLPLPVGPEITGTRVRWTLLTPAIFPVIPENSAKGVPAHPGGWLPTWIHSDFQVQLKDSAQSARQAGEGRAKWRKRVAALPPIAARLVAAKIPQALPVTGWSLGQAGSEFGARATHLAVPAGSVYYFDCADETSARQLATALNWHGPATPAKQVAPASGLGKVPANVPLAGRAILHRRSTLLGEKGFGLGVCSCWKPRLSQA